MGTNPNIETDDRWMFDSAEAGTSYQMYFACRDDDDSPGIYAMRKDEDSPQCVQAQRVIASTEMSANAMNGAEIAMEFDCNAQSLRFLYNNKMIGNVYVEKADCYYAAVAYNTYDSGRG